MAIRRPSVYRQNELVFQDFLEYDAGVEGELRYILAKWDGESFFYTAQTSDYPLPDVQGGPIVARIDYTLIGEVVTIDSWEINWQDEWPLRLAVQFLVHCLYRPAQGYVVRVNKEVYPFWVSENFFPITNEPNDYLIEGT